MLARLDMRCKTGHAFVLGSGIAGLSIAEILSRNGWRITLVESSPHLGGDASRSTQNWLHTGWLYAGLPYTSAMRGCATSLRLYRKTYARAFGSHVVNVVADDRGVEYPTSSAGWFSAERVHYVFAISTAELSAGQRITWCRYLDCVPLRRLRALGYPTDPLLEMPPGLLDLMNRWEGDENGHTRYRVIPSTDARIDTRRVLTSLLRALGDRAQVLTNASCELVRERDRTVLRIDGERHVPDLCVLATGKSVASLLARLGAVPLARAFKSVASPIVVLRRALDLPSFIRFTPNLPHTVNHIKYPVEGREVSTIGSYDYHAVDERPDIGPFVEKVCSRLGVATSEVVGSYYGTKTELTGSLARRYNHAVGVVNDNTYFAIAGKFSQFPLLVTELAGKLGLRADADRGSRGELAMEIAATAPERLVKAEAESGAKPHAA